MMCDEKAIRNFLEDAPTPVMATPVHYQKPIQPITVLVKKRRIMKTKDEYPAKYIAQVIEDYKGNPFIEALPPIMPSAEAAVNALSVKPVYSEAERELE
jgi:hypothetical protein